MTTIQYWRKEKLITSIALSSYFDQVWPILLPISPNVAVVVGFALASLCKKQHNMVVSFHTNFLRKLLRFRSRLQAAVSIINTVNDKIRTNDDY